MCFVNELLRESTAVPSLAVLKYSRINSHLIDGKGMTLLYCLLFSYMWAKPEIAFLSTCFSQKWQKEMLVRI